MKPRTTCPDCNAALTPIIPRVAYYHVLDGYESPDSKPNWVGHRPPAGKLHSLMCSECGRVLIYAVPLPPKT
jgi:hypothetical protein